MKTTLLATAVALTSLATSAVAQTANGYGYTTAIKGGTSTVMPPASHAGQWWTHPSGCEYSRTGRPGEVVWFLIINTSRPECPTYIATKGGADVY
ncbi:MAG: hypothetical protein RID11_03105 [Roseovarius sp.]|jgi:hypothetical protein|uniref:hypothetical protein n=1 Tax=Roseovarius sp. TaxID=1486281 RepID=UPI0032EE9043